MGKLEIKLDFLKWIFYLKLIKSKYKIIYINYFKLK